MSALLGILYVLTFYYILTTLNLAYSKEYVLSIRLTYNKHIV